MLSFGVGQRNFQVAFGLLLHITEHPRKDVEFRVMKNGTTGGSLSLEKLTIFMLSDTENGQI